MEDIFITFNKKLKALQEVGGHQLLYEKISEAVPNKLMTVEGACSAIDEALNGEKELRESNRGSRQPIKRGNNSTTTTTSEKGGFTDPRELQVKSYMRTANLTEAQARKVVGLPERTANELNLSENEFRQYSAYLQAGYSEAEALTAASPTYSHKLNQAVRRGSTVSQFLESIKQVS
jgi:hypothetical protein